MPNLENTSFCSEPNSSDCAVVVAFKKLLVSLLSGIIIDSTHLMEDSSVAWEGQVGEVPRLYLVTSASILGRYD